MLDSCTTEKTFTTSQHYIQTSSSQVQYLPRYISRAESRFRVHLSACKRGVNLRLLGKDRFSRMRHCFDFWNRTYVTRSVYTFIGTANKRSKIVPKYFFLNKLVFPSHDHDGSACNTMPRTHYLRMQLSALFFSSLKGE